MEMADWARNHAIELAKLLKLRRAWMPHHNPIRRVFQNIDVVDQQVVAQAAIDGKEYEGHIADAFALLITIKSRS
jgi:hypothetical protein